MVHKRGMEQAALSAMAADGGYVQGLRIHSVAPAVLQATPCDGHGKMNASKSRVMIPSRYSAQCRDPLPFRTVSE